jgi:hypothetical protein
MRDFLVGRHGQTNNCFCLISVVVTLQVSLAIDVIRTRRIALVWVRTGVPIYIRLIVLPSPPIVLSSH